MIPASYDELPDRLVKWIVDSVNSKAKIKSVRKLHGGASSVVHCITLIINEVEKDFVLRQFDNEEWLRNEPDLAIHEAKSLLLAAQVEIHTPEIIAYDEKGIKCGVPSVLMTKIEGTVNLKPDNIENWLNEQAESLVRIHSVEATDFPWAYFTYNDISSLKVPSWSRYPDKWSRVINIVKGPKPKVKECFIHRDYHPTNVLWNGTKISGIVDWVNACRGPAGIDIGHCRLNLAQLFDVHTADEFLVAYQKHAGKKFKYDPYWDLVSLIEILYGPPTVYPGWAAFGVEGLTNKMMEDRLDQYMINLLNQI